MEKSLQVFQNGEFGSIQVIEEDGRVLFGATDVAKALGYSNARDAISRHCRYVVKHDVPHPQNPEKTIEMNFITEADVYRLICGSKLESAQEFERWVFEEVLPTVRKHGAYMTPEKLEEVLLNPDMLISLAQALKEERQKRSALEAQAEVDKPKVLFANSVTASKTSILIGDLAKLLRQNGVKTGQNRLFQWMRDNGYLIKRKGDSFNMPTQSSMEAGLFEVLERTHTNPDGSIRIVRTTKVTGRGSVYFINRFLNA